MGIEDIRALGIPGLLHIVPISGSKTLYRARQLSKDRAVALRFLDQDLDADDGLRADCVVRALQTLSQHPHIVTVYGSGQVADGPMYLLIELQEEGSLGEWVSADGRLPCAEVLDVAVKISGALETAHRAGIVHGRLRPESILVSSSGEPQLAGLDQAMVRSIQASRNGAALPSTDDDLTALASTMFTLLTAANPGDELVREALERCEVPAPVRGLIERCLAKDHALRPSSIQNLATAIQQVQQVLSFAVTEIVVDERTAEQVYEALHEFTAPPQIEEDPREPEPTEPDSELEPEPELEDNDGKPELGPAPTLPDSEPDSQSEPDAEPDLEEAESDSEPEPEPTLEAPEPEVEPSPALAPPEPWPALTSPASEPESEPVLTPPEQEPESALVAPARPARLRWRRVVMIAGLTLLGAAVALAGALLLRRDAVPPAADDRSSPVVVEEQPASNRDAVYKGFRTITDESGQLSMIVPEEWSAVRSSPWIVDGENVGSRLEAALDSPAGGPWSRPFAVLAMSQTLGTTRTVDQVLDQLRILPGEECTYIGRAPFNDNLYEGAIDSYSGCGQPATKIEILVATSKNPSHLVMVQVNRLGPRDENAHDRVMETFQVSG